MEIQISKLLIAIGFIIFQLYCNGQELPEKSTKNIKWDNNKLNIENKAIQLQFEKTLKGVELLRIKNKELDQIIQFDEGGSLFSLGNLTDSILSYDFNVKKIAETASSYNYLELENILTYKKIDVKIRCCLYPNSPMAVFHFYIKKKSNDIEFSPEQISLLRLKLEDRHWLFRSAEFTDWTDYHNTFVQEHEGISYIYPTKLRGNVLWAKDLLSQNSLVFLKEAPGTSVQLHSPDYDFFSHNRLFSVAGAGLIPEDLAEEEWVRTYSVAIGVSGKEEIDFLKTLRRYQKCWRKIIPERDDMIMMNTWGDRSQDASIGEDFLRKEIDVCQKLHLTHFQIDDGWQSGRSTGSASGKGTLWDEWTKKDWQPDSGRFPSGMKIIGEYSGEKGVKLGLWFHPSNENEYARCEQDIETLIGLYNDYNIKCFKIDGVKLKTKKAESNFRHILDSVSKATNNDVVFNLDMTHDERAGYFYFYEYGNVFLENRYTDWGGYYPYWTLRNLWQLSKYVPAEKFQIEFLNNQRNRDKYPKDDIFAPGNIPFDYTFAITMMAQPLAWFEGSNLSDKGYEIAPLIQRYKEVQAEIHSGMIFPVGDEPSGRSWTGFQSILDDNTGYLLVFREYNEMGQGELQLYDATGKTFTFEKILGYGESFKQTAKNDGKITFTLPGMNRFVLYKYHRE